MDALFTGAVNEAEREVDGFLQGLAVGIVTDNKDPEGLARVRVRLPWQIKRPVQLLGAHRDADGRRRARHIFPSGNRRRGAASARRTATRPTSMSSACVWNGKQKPPENNDDGKNDRRVIHSRSGHRLIFDDGAQPRVELLARRQEAPRSRPERRDAGRRQGQQARHREQLRRDHHRVDTPASS